MKKFLIGSDWLAYDVYGAQDGVPLVFLHGATVDHVSMKNTFEQYFRGDDGYLRIYVDLPGHGESGHSVFRASMEAMLEGLGSFMRGNFTAPPCVVGYSMGGFLALKLAEQIRFPAMFLVAPPVCTNKDKVARPEAMTLSMDRLTEEERKSADPRYLRLAVKKTSETLKRYRANLVAGFSPGKWLYKTKLLRNAAEENMTIDPSLIESSTAFLVGQQDLLVGYRDQFELSSKLKFSEYHVFSDCGHFLPVECAQFEQIFRIWLRTAVPKPGARVIEPVPSVERTAAALQIQV